MEDSEVIDFIGPGPQPGTEVTIKVTLTNQILGRGSFGTVYYAYQQGKSYAVKCINEKSAE